MNDGKIAAFGILSVLMVTGTMAFLPGVLQAGDRNGSRLPRS
jgi:hypothetical protein